jgi:hypothetical protein
MIKKYSNKFPKYKETGKRLFKRPENIEVIYNIDIGDLIGVGSGNNNTQYSCNNTNQGFQWIDTIPISSLIVSVKVEFKIGAECESGVKNSSLNGAPQPDFNSSVYHCSTSYPGPAPLITLNLNPSDYNIGQNNVFGTGNHGSCFGFERDPILDNYFAQITVVYK